VSIEERIRKANLVGVESFGSQLRGWKDSTGIIGREDSIVNCLPDRIDVLVSQPAAYYAANECFRMLQSLVAYLMLLDTANPQPPGGGGCEG
jgi:hypothetical protein